MNPDDTTNNTDATDCHLAGVCFSNIGRLDGDADALRADVKVLQRGLVFLAKKSGCLDELMQYLEQNRD